LLMSVRDLLRRESPYGIPFVTNGMPFVTEWHAVRDLLRRESPYEGVTSQIVNVLMNESCHTSLLSSFILSDFSIKRVRDMGRLYRGDVTYCNTHNATHTLQHTHCNTHTATHTLQHTQCNTHTATHTLQHTHCNTHTATHTLQHTHCNTPSATHTLQHTQK